MVMETIAEQELAARLRKINLDLLPVLHELLRTKSVTSTALQKLTKSRREIPRLSNASGKFA